MGIYLGTYKAYHEGANIDYQDINGKRDIPGDMLEVDLTPYDYIIATPPCNYYSRANYRRERSTYAQKTKHLLPEIIKKLISINKPFIVENVRNKRIFSEIGLYDVNCNVYIIGRHTYWTNIEIPTDIPQIQDFVQHGIYIGRKSGEIKDHNTREGGENVKRVIDTFLKKIGALNEKH